MRLSGSNRENGGRRSRFRQHFPQEIRRLFRSDVSPRKGRVDGFMLYRNLGLGHLSIVLKQGRRLNALVKGKITV